MYSIKAILEKEPVVIAGAIRSVLFVGVLMSLIVLDEKQLAGIALALELVLGLFARQVSVPAVKVEEAKAEAVAEAIADAYAESDPA